MHRVALPPCRKSRPRSGVGFQGYPGRATKSFPTHLQGPVPHQPSLYNSPKTAPNCSTHPICKQLQLLFAGSQYLRRDHAVGQSAVSELASGAVSDQSALASAGVSKHGEAPVLHRLALPINSATLKKVPGAFKFRNISHAADEPSRASVRPPPQHPPAIGTQR